MRKLESIYYNIYYNNYNYLKCFIILIYTFVDRRRTFGYVIWVYQIPIFVSINGIVKHVCVYASAYRQNVIIYYDSGSHNIIQNSLVNPNRILLPPLHVILGIMKNVIKVLDRNGTTMQFMRNKFLKISESKITAGILNCPQIR